MRREQRANIYNPERMKLFPRRSRLFMNIRNSRVITSLFVCHLLLAPGLLTSQLLLPIRSGFGASGSQETPQVRRQEPPPVAKVSASEDEPVTISSKQQEKDGDVYKLSGEVEIEFRDFVLRADEIIYNTVSGEVTANGHLSLDGDSNDEHIEASRGEYNVRTRTGRFWDVVGTTGVRFRGRNVSLTSTDPFAFTGKMVEKVSDSRYVVHHGTVTSCRLPDPKWTFNAQKIVVDVGGSAKIYNSSFRIRGVPVLYLPFAAHPAVPLARQTGFLVPTFGASSRKGTIIGESFYWAINRSADATLGAEYYSSRGWAQHGEFRAKPSGNSYIDASYFGVLDRGFGPLNVDQGGQDIKLNGEVKFTHGFRGVASINYLSSFVFRLAFTENFTQAVNSEVKSLAFFSKGYRNYFFNMLAARYQNFQSATKGDLITILRVPSFEGSSAERQLWKSPLYWSYTAAVEGVSRREPSFKTNDLVARIDVNPRAAVPLFYKGWSLRTELGLRNTYYTQRKSSTFGVGTPLNDALNRRAFEITAEMRPPTVGRIFDRSLLGRKVKHTIEPRVGYRLVNGVSGFSNIIRFDYRDTLSDTSELEYGLIQRLFLKKGEDCTDRSPGENCQSAPREFITWEVAQRYYFDDMFGGSVVAGKRNVLTTTTDFSGIAFLTEPRRFSPIQSKLRLRATSNIDGQWHLDYDSKKGRIQSSTVFVNYRLGDFFVGGSHAFLHSPGEIFISNPIPGPDKFDQFRVLLGYGAPSKRGLSTSAGVGVDSGRGFLQYSSFQNTYNWDCCGISMEYRRFALGSVRNENQFRFAFNLANIGTFGNMRRQEKLF